MKYILGLVCLSLFAAQSWVQNGNTEMYVGDGNDKCCHRPQWKSCLDIVDPPQWGECPDERPDPCNDPSCVEHDWRGFCQDAFCKCNEGYNCEDTVSIPPWEEGQGIHTAADSCYVTGDYEADFCFDDEYEGDPPVLIPECYRLCVIDYIEWDGTQPSWVTQEYKTCNGWDTETCPVWWAPSTKCPNGGVSPHPSGPCIDTY
ncbi:MAG: hypothetical protein DWQ19_10380 [Crenarchaeota archaeon]|nr:MAG: hypothetical protein DWQ19_10380 [Thermoproteota archaeon]